MSKHKLPTTTVSQSRLATFAPVSNVRSNGTALTTVHVESKNWGKATITGNLNQSHRSILDVLFSCYKPIFTNQGTAVFLVAKYDFLKRLKKDPRDGRNHKWLEDRFDDLRVAKLRIETDEHNFNTGIVALHGETKKPLRGRYYYGVEISKTYLKFIDSETGIRYTEAQLDIILGLPPVAQAVTRFMLSHFITPHFTPNFRLRDVLDDIGLKSASPRTRQRAVKTVIECAQEMSRPELGITFSGAGADAVLSRCPTAPAVEHDPAQDGDIDIEQLMPMELLETT